MYVGIALCDLIVLIVFYVIIINMVFIYTTYNLIIIIILLINRKCVFIQIYWNKLKQNIQNYVLHYLVD